MGLLSIGSSGLLAAYTQLQTTGHNIANANSPGYSRQEVILSSAGSNYGGGGYVGRGVDVVDVRRRYDRFVNTELAASTAASAADAARAEQLGRIDELFGDPTVGPGAAVDELNAAVADLASRPGDTSARSVVLSRASSLAARFNTLDASIADVSQSIETRAQGAVSTLNQGLQALARLNQVLIRDQSGAAANNDLLDQRDQLVRDINQQLQASVYINDDGTASLFAANGTALVTGASAATVALKVDRTGVPGSGLTISTTSGPAANPTTHTTGLDSASLGGGALAGLLQARDVDVSALRAGLGQLAGAIAGAYNAVQEGGLDAQGNAGKPLFAIEAQVVGLPGDAEADAEAVAVSITDGKKLKASDYRLDFDGSSYKVTRLADGKDDVPFTLSGSGDVLRLDDDGLEVTLGAGSMPSGSSLLLRTASSFAGSIASAGRTTAEIATGKTGALSPSSDNSNAREMAALSTAALVDGASVPDALATLVADVGTRTQSAKAAETISGRLLDAATTAREKVAGVNLDEEAARLIQFQQAYQAAAKVIQAAQSMFQSLMQAAG